MLRYIYHFLFIFVIYNIICKHKIVLSYNLFIKLGI